MLPYLIPYLAYREVPQESTGFSPFKLIYGRHVRGPLDVLKEEWQASSKSSGNVVSPIVEMRSRLQSMMEVVQKNLGEAQRKQKVWYDRGARTREFSEGSEVLVLLPTSNNSLGAE